MTEIMAHQGLDLAPSSRQDIVSALLNDYGSSFGHGDTSPYDYSPVQAYKELPPPPPEKENKYNNDKPLPSAGYTNMSMRFQLRVDEPVSPESPDGSRSSSESPRRRITSRSLSRSSKPPSLKLLASNGSTATLPATPKVASQASTPVPYSRQAKEEEKDLPPPPPEKSELRQQRRPSMETPSSGRPRVDSLQSQEGKSGNEATGPIKRKPLPKFTSLAQLGNGPRGGKGGPLPVPRPRKQSVEQDKDQTSNERPATAVEAKIVDVQPRSSKSSDKARNEEQTPRRDIPPVVNQLPPTPDENPAPAPPPPRKPFAGMGLPSNPRARGQETPKHIRGKSSTGFDLMMKEQKSAPPLAPVPNTITPGPTPSPGQTEKIQQTRSPVSPIKETEQRRPFSFEAAATPAPPPKQQRSAPGPASARPASPVSPIEPPASNVTQFPPRSTSRVPPPAFVGLPSQQRTPSPEESSPPAFANHPSQQRVQRSPSPDELAPPTPKTPPPFTPLTVKPTPTNAPPITSKHLHCYSHHSTSVWSRNDFQPMACMVCKTNDRERKWACVWCYLRICVGCSQELMKTPSHDLGVVLEKRGFETVVDGGVGRRNDEDAKRHDSGNPSVVVWEADGDDDFS